MLDNVYVTSYNQRDNYTRYVNNTYKRKTYVKIIINQKLDDLPNNMQERIINESNNIFQFNKTNINKRKSFFFIFIYV